MLLKRKKVFSAGACGVEIKPYKKTKGLEPAKDMLKALTGGVYSFEIWSKRGEKGRVIMFASEPAETFIKKLNSYYPYSEIIPLGVEEFPLSDYRIDEIVAMKFFSTKIFYPFNTDFIGDPLNLIASSIVGHDAVFQVTFRGAEVKWSKYIAKAAKYESSPKVVGWFRPRVIEASSVEKDLARDLTKKAKSTLFCVDIRLCCSIYDAEKTIPTICSALDSFTKTPQAFKPVRVKGITKGRQLSNTEKFLKSLISRVCYGYVVMSVEELKWLVHIPGEEVSADLNWTFEKKDVYIPF